MSSLILDSLEIRNFRAFRHLQIERLARVNLFVGKNNVGKTSLLEALQLYVRRGSPSLITKLLQSRDEAPLGLRTFGREERDETEESGLAIRHLFYGHPSVGEAQEHIFIGPIGSTTDSVSIALDWYTPIADIDPRQQPLFEGYNTPEASYPTLTIDAGNQQPIVYSLYRYFMRRPSGPERSTFRNFFVSANGLSNLEMSRLWDDVSLTNLEDNVVDALRIIAPQVERVNFVNRVPQNRDRIPIVRIAASEEPISLRSMGEGMNRILGLSLALANTGGGMLFIDEVESGLHYSVQTEVWRLILQAAHRFNIQVFATTHSKDCIDAFQQAAKEDEQVEGLLYSLREKRGKPGEVVAIPYDEERLEIATTQQIEVR